MLRRASSLDVFFGTTKIMEKIHEIWTFGLDIMAVQDVRWGRVAVFQQMIIYFSIETGLLPIM